MGSLERKCWREHVCDEYDYDGWRRQSSVKEVCVFRSLGFGASMSCHIAHHTLDVLAFIHFCGFGYIGKSAKKVYKGP